MSPLRRRGTAQTSFPEDRGVWLGVAVVLTVLIAWLVVNRGPYGGPITTFGAVVRTLLLVLLAALPLVALAWAWKRLPRLGRRVAPIPIGVLAVFLLLYSVAHSSIYAERVRMGRDPGRLAASAFQRGNTRFLAVEDSLGGLHAPPVINRCLINRYETRVIPGTDGMTVNAAHARYRAAAAERAERYNQVLIQRLRIPPEEVNRFAEGFCPD